MSAYLPGSLNSASTSRAPLSPRSVLSPSSYSGSSMEQTATRRVVIPSLRKASASMGLERSVEKVAHKVMDMSRESSDINMLADRVMGLIDSYGNSSKIAHKLLKHEASHVKEALKRLALTYLVRREILKVLVVMEQYHYVKDYLGEELAFSARKELVNKILKKLRKYDLHEWVEKFANY